MSTKHWGDPHEPLGKTSVWIRVSTVHAGGSSLGGDPDRPLILGLVPNG